MNATTNGEEVVSPTEEPTKEVSLAKEDSLVNEGSPTAVTTTVTVDMEKKTEEEEEKVLDMTPVPFVVCGPYQDNIDAATAALDLIVGGERIRDVLNLIKTNGGQ